MLISPKLCSYKIYERWIFNDPDLHQINRFYINLIYD